jgi:hypothetical protein
MPISYKESYECQKFAGRSLTGYLCFNESKEKFKQNFCFVLTALATGAFYA